MENKQEKPIVRDIGTAVNCKWLEIIGNAPTNESTPRYCELWCHATPYSKKVNSIDYCRKCNKHTQKCEDDL